MTTQLTSHSGVNGWVDLTNALPRAWDTLYPDARLNDQLARAFYVSSQARGMGLRWHSRHPSVRVNDALTLGALDLEPFAKQITFAMSRACIQMTLLGERPDGSRYVAGTYKVVIVAPANFVYSWVARDICGSEYAQGAPSAESIAYYRELIPV